MVSTFCTFHLILRTIMYLYYLCFVNGTSASHTGDSPAKAHMAGRRQARDWPQGPRVPGSQGPRPVHLLRSWLLHTQLPIKGARAVVTWKPRLYQRTPPVRPFKKQACVYFYKIVHCWKNSKYDRGTRQTFRLQRQEIIIRDTGVFSQHFSITLITVHTGLQAPISPSL